MLRVAVVVLLSFIVVAYAATTTQEQQGVLEPQQGAHVAAHITGSVAETNSELLASDGEEHSGSSWYNDANLLLYGC
jgi:hypothetical protein